MRNITIDLAYASQKDPPNAQEFNANKIFKGVWDKNDAHSRNKDDVREIGQRWTQKVPPAPTEMEW